MDEVRAVEFVLKMYDMGFILPEQLQGALDFAHQEGYNIMLEHSKEASKKAKWEICQKVMEATIENAY
jgi:hypothetical protein